MMASRSGQLEITITFLRSIGLELELESDCHGLHGFLPFIQIREGRLHYSFRTLPSDLLHEAGHLAVLPSEWRRHVSGNVDLSLAPLFDSLKNMELEPDCALQRAAVNCGDCEATAWAWAAGMHLGMTAEEIIPDEELHYEGHGGEVRQMLQMGRYFGIHGLQHAGFCLARPRAGEPAFPHMRFWLQPA